jgi:membrane associated rhomboid family serine protease
VLAGCAIGADAGTHPPTWKDQVFVFAAAVPALMVVIVGYVLGYAVAQWICDLLGVGAARTPEVAGWITGLVLLGVVLRLLLNRWRRRPASPDRQSGDHQK